MKIIFLRVKWLQDKLHCVDAIWYLFGLCAFVFVLISLLFEGHVENKLYNFIGNLYKNKVNSITIIIIIFMSVKRGQYQDVEVDDVVVPGPGDASLHPVRLHERLVVLVPGECGLGVGGALALDDEVLATALLGHLGLLLEHGRLAARFTRLGTCTAGGENWGLGAKLF